MQPVQKRTRARLRRIAPMPLAFALVVGGAAATQIVASTPASATTYTCGEQLLGSAWSSTFTGVPVYSNGADDATETSCGAANGDNYVNNIDGVPEDSGGEWQCVELVNRLYLTKGWIMSHWKGNGDTLEDNLPPGLSAQPNGAITSIVPGDVVTYVEVHAGVVSAVNGDTVTIVNQNAGYPVTQTVTYDPSTKTLSGEFGFTTQAVIHAAANTGSGGINPRPPPPPSALVVAGSSGGVWSADTPNPLAYVYSGTATQVAVSPNRIAVVDSSGNAYLEDLRAATPTFNFLMANVAQIAITDDKIAVLDTSGNAWATDSGFTLSTVASGVKQIALSENRLVVVGTNNTAYVKVGSTTAPGWEASWSNVSSAAVSDDMLALLNPSGDAYCSTGTDISDTMYYVTSGVAQVAVGKDASGNDRLGILGTDTNVYLNTGSCSSISWDNIASDVSALSMSGPLIAVESPSGGVWAGTTATTLQSMASNVTVMATGS